MSQSEDHSFSSIKHSTLADLARNPAKIEMEAKAAGHTGNLVDLVDAAKAEKHVDVPLEKKKEKIVAVNGHGTRGQIFVFRPTGGRVTVVLEKVGNAYDGTWIHEVVDREGKKFLASMKQLINPV